MSKVIRRGRSTERTDRTWYFWHCEVCGDKRHYLNESAMVTGSHTHREVHKDGKQHTVDVEK